MKLGLIFVVFACLVASISKSEAGTIEVGKGQAQTIRDAIATANPRDTVVIPAGLYREGNLLIEKPLTIIGRDFPVLDGQNKFEILTIHANGVTVSGLKLINTGVASISDIAAIKVLSSRNVRISNNRLENAFFGIHLSNTSDSHVQGNEIISTNTNELRKANGIHLWKCQNATVKDNTIKHHRDGIYFEFVTGSTISGNHSEGNLRYGLHFMFSHNDLYTNNTFINNGAGVAVMYSKEVTMTGNNFLHNWGDAAYGLLLKDIRDSKVTGNNFDDNSVGIFMEGSSRIEFRSNNFRRNGYGVRLQASCDDNQFSANNFIGNTFDLVTNGSLVLNKITGNYWDKYDGYDLNHDRIGDVPFRPISLYSTIIEQTPSAIMLWRSFLVFLLDRAERAIPAVTPENLVDGSPFMNPL